MKKYSIVLNNRRHLKVSHNQRKQLNSSGYPSCGPRIFESCTRKVHKKSKNYASRRGPIEHLVVFWQTPQGVCKKRNFTLQGGLQVAEGPRVLSVLFCLLSCPAFYFLFYFFLRNCSRFDLIWFRLSCDDGWIRSGSVNVRKTATTTRPCPLGRACIVLCYNQSVRAVAAFYACRRANSRK